MAGDEKDTGADGRVKEEIVSGITGEEGDGMEDAVEDGGLEAVAELKDLNWDAPSEEQKTAWKSEYGEKRVKECVFPGIVPGTAEPLEDGSVDPDNPAKYLNFVFRLLKRSEYRDLLYGANANPDTREDTMCQMCVLWPQNIVFKEHFDEQSEKAGLPSMIVEYIMDQSGFIPAVQVGNV